MLKKKKKKKKTKQKNKKKNAFRGIVSRFSKNKNSIQLPLLFCFDISEFPTLHVLSQFNGILCRDMKNAMCVCVCVCVCVLIFNLLFDH